MHVFTVFIIIIVAADDVDDEDLRVVRVGVDVRICIHG